MKSTKPIQLCRLETTSKVVNETEIAKKNKIKQ